MRLRGQVVVVTGSSRGIGRAIAAALLGEGALVAGCSRNLGDGPERPGSYLDDAPDVSGHEGFLRGCDVRKAGDVQRFAEEVIEKLGPPAVLVNNAGIVARAPIDSLDEETWDDVIDANLKGTFLVTRAFLPAMRKQSPREGIRGRIINIASISGRQGTAGLTAYCAAKHGVVGLTRALAEELRPAQITVNAVCPGSVDTDMLRTGMPGAAASMTAAEVARTVLFLAVEAPAALTGSCVDLFG